jgi:hypothetical protein
VNGTGFAQSSDTREASVRAATAARAWMDGGGAVTVVKGACPYELAGRPVAPSLGPFIPVEMLDCAFDPMLHVTAGQHHGLPLDLDARSVVSRLVLAVGRDGGGPCRFDVGPGPGRSRLPDWTGVPTVLAERAG